MRPAPPLIVWMSFRLAIPWWVALPQGPPPLRQPVLIMRYSHLAGRGIFIERRTVSYLFVSAEGTSAIVSCASFFEVSANGSDHLSPDKTGLSEVRHVLRRENARRLQWLN
jgi:hypothetical protein